MDNNAIVIADQIEEAALGILQGVIPESVVYNPALRRVEFHFRDSDGSLSESIRRHRCGKETVSSMGFTSAMREVRRQIHALRQAAN